MIQPILNIDLIFEQILELYKSVGWEAYTNRPENLRTALKNSSYILGHYNESGKLDGVIRGLTDNISINYIQDILVFTDLHNKGIGSKLLQHVLDKYKDVRCNILLTDDDPGQLAFYKKCFMQNTKDIKDYTLNTFVKFA